MNRKLRVGILGGTGMVGQRFISLLEDHPWFEVTTIAASPRSAGKTYEECVEGRWKMDTPVPEAIKKIVVKNVQDVESVSAEVDFCFSAVDMSKDEIRAIEEEYAKTETPVVSNNSAHRWTPDVPMIIPEINPEHSEVIPFQKKRLGTTRGFIAVKPNCSIQSYTPAFAAWKEFEPYQAVVSTYQAISGAGKVFRDWPEMNGNIIPYIGGEEEKSEKEPLRVFGHIENGVIVPGDNIKITSQCIRVPVLYGHTASVFVNFRKDPSKEEIRFMTETFMKALITKDFVWEYEHEWRMLISAGDDRFVNMPPISCVYIGAQCSDDNKQKLMAVAQEKGIPIKQMVLDRGEYELHAVEC